MVERLKMKATPKGSAIKASLVIDPMTLHYSTKINKGRQDKCQQETSKVHS